MERKQSLLVFDRREMVLLWLIGVVLAIFAFTLGVHFGKHLITGGGAARNAAEPGAVATVGDVTPTRQELAEQGKAVPEAIDDSLNRALHEEVVLTGVKLDQPRQVELPSKTKSKMAGATTLTEKPAATAPGARPEHPAAAHSAGGFIIQVGSFPELELAKRRLQAMEEKGLKPELKTVELPGKGTWYRLFIAGFDSREAADQAGKKYRSDRRIDSYIVSKHE